MLRISLCDSLSISSWGKCTSFSVEREGGEIQQGDSELEMRGGRGLQFKITPLIRSGRILTCSSFSIRAIMHQKIAWW